MSKILYNLNGRQNLVEVGIGGGVTEDVEILWHEQKDGSMPEVDLQSQPARRVVLEAKRDANGKQLYRKEILGTNKTQARKVARRDKYLELYSTVTGDIIIRKYLGEDNGT